MKAAWFGACAVVLGSGATLFAAEASAVLVVSHGGSATVTAWANYEGNGIGFTETRVNHSNRFSFARGRNGRNAGFGEDGFRQSQSYAVASQFGPSVRGTSMRGMSMRGTMNPHVSRFGRQSAVNTPRVRSNAYPSRRATVSGVSGVRGLAGSHRSQSRAVSATHNTNGSRRAVRAGQHSTQRYSTQRYSTQRYSTQRRGVASRRHETRRSHGSRHETQRSHGNRRSHR